MEEEQITETIQVTGKYPCRKCLLRKWTRMPIWRICMPTMTRIEEDSKADKAVYEDRLAACKRMQISE